MKIEKCPFCGGEAIPCSTGNHFAAEKFFVACGVCGVETPRIARTRKEAIAAWNRRAQPDHIGDTTEMIGKWPVTIGNTFCGAKIVGADYLAGTVTLKWGKPKEDA